MIDRSYIFIFCMLTQIWIWTTGVWSVKYEFLCWVEQLLRAGLSSLHLSVKACKISRSQICKKVILFSQVLSSGTRLQRSAIRNVLVSMSFTIQSKQMSAVYKYSNYFFFTLAWGERTSASQGWSDCSWSGLVSLQCPVLVSSPVFVPAHACLFERTQPRAFLHACTHRRNFIDRAPNTKDAEKFLNLLRTQQDEILNTGWMFEKLEPFYSAKTQLNVIQQLTLCWKQTACHMHK